MNDAFDTPAPGGPIPGPGYEFGPAEDAVIRDTGRWVTWWGWIAIVAGALLIVSGVLTLAAGGLSQIIMGGIYVLIGVYFRGAGSGLGKVVETSGDDVGHLMGALGRLTSAFRIQVILVVVGLALSIIMAVIAMMGDA